MADTPGTLSDVLTIQEVMRFWKKAESSVRYHINRGNFRYRLTSSGRYLVKRESVLALWGQPVCDIDAGDIFE